MQGWIKLHRKILDNPIASRPNYLAVWVHLLLIANHEPKSFIWNNEKSVCDRGQIYTGRLALSEATGVPPSTVEDILSYLEREGQIRQQKYNKFRLITVINYSEYQEVRQQSDNKATTKRQQTDTNKNEKNYKNEKKVSESRFTPPTLNEVSEYVKTNGYNVDAEVFMDFYESKGWKVGNQKMKNWQAAVRTWHRKNGGAKRVPQTPLEILTKYFEPFTDPRELVANRIFEGKNIYQAKRELEFQKDRPEWDLTNEVKEIIANKDLLTKIQALCQK